MDLHIRIESAFLWLLIFALTFRKAKFFGVPSRAVVKFGCALGKKIAGHWTRGLLLVGSMTCHTQAE
jgi:hypothetical protein